ncbi:uncharacterized protein SAPINGB_P006489 [Magnusiomyces paraingens]|uniref:Uncharacterized protein n=1 Tax=Magnusiomyces paraingens TaxID=2606893 RepID=A0A5E8C665_9ASCO|nr:uncharacterized protein SAPINGB_P006489 [Saprochaete ingens]VVT58997.1 unnamed protein product [Saprochaete ingens]
MTPSQSLETYNVNVSSSGMGHLISLNSPTNGDFYWQFVQLQNLRVDSKYSKVLDKPDVDFTPFIRSLTLVDKNNILKECVSNLKSNLTLDYRSYKSINITAVQNNALVKAYYDMSNDLVAIVRYNTEMSVTDLYAISPILPTNETDSLVGYSSNFMTVNEVAHRFTEISTYSNLLWATGEHETIVDLTQFKSDDSQFYNTEILDELWSEINNTYVKVVNKLTVRDPNGIMSNATRWLNTTIGIEIKKISDNSGLINALTRTNLCNMVRNQENAGILTLRSLWDNFEANFMDGIPKNLTVNTQVIETRYDMAPIVWLLISCILLTIVLSLLPKYNNGRFINCRLPEFCDYVRQTNTDDCTQIFSNKCRLKVYAISKFGEKGYIGIVSPNEVVNNSNEIALW